MASGGRSRLEEDCASLIITPDTYQQSALSALGGPRCQNRQPRTELGGFRVVDQACHESARSAIYCEEDRGELSRITNCLGITDRECCWTDGRSLHHELDSLTTSGRSHSRTPAARSETGTETTPVQTETASIHQDDALELSMSYLQLNQTVVDPYLQDEDGDTMLHLALISRPPIESFTNYIIRGATSVSQLNIQNNLYQTAAHLAVATDQPNVVRYLVRLGVSLTSQEGSHGDTVLHLASRLGHVDCFRAVVDELASSDDRHVLLAHLFDAVNYEGETCLHLAARLDDKEIFSWLINHSAVNVNVKERRRGQTTLHIAVDRNDVVVIKMLLAYHHKLSINETTYDGLTALDFAECRHLDSVETLLIDAGAVRGSSTIDSQPDDFDMSYE